MHSTEYKIVTENKGVSCSSVYFRSSPSEDWIFLTEFFGQDSADKAEKYLKLVKQGWRLDPE